MMWRQLLRTVLIAALVGSCYVAPPPISVPFVESHASGGSGIKARAIKLKNKKKSRSKKKSDKQETIVGKSHGASKTASKQQTEIKPTFAKGHKDKVAKGKSANAKAKDASTTTAKATSGSGPIQPVFQARAGLKSQKSTKVRDKDGNIVKTRVTSDLAIKTAKTMQGKTYHEALKIADRQLAQKGWNKGPSRDGNGVRYTNPKRPDETVIVNKGNYKGAEAGNIHSGPYVKVSSQSVRARIGLK
nr:hypothetical protein [uncultured Hyphomonas sp.]